MDRQAALLAINNEIITHVTREPLFRAITDALRRVIPFDRTAIFLHDPARDGLRLYVLTSTFPSPYFRVGLEMPLESHVGRVFTRRQSFLRRDLAREREYEAEDHAYADGVRSYVIVPLLARGTAVGTLAVASTKAEQYDDEDVVFLQSVANQVGLAVVNMLAYEEIAALKARLERENAYLQEEIHAEHNFAEMAGSSPALRETLRQVSLVAPTDSTVLITGETGTGKELIARALHDRSARRNRPLVKVNCGAIAAGLVESELFGHVKGAFTGALERRIGRFQLADGGTIFLDEVGELPPDTQVKLLRVLQDHEFEPVGSSQTLRVDVRVIAATNRDLQQAVKDGRFRADLFYRLNVVPLVVPPLRDRCSDVPELALLFLTRFARRFGKRIDSISDETMRALVAYPWPGNVRELQNVVERAVVLSPGPELSVPAEVLTAPVPAVVDPAPDLPTLPPRSKAGLNAVLEQVERDQIAAALRESGGIVDGPRGAAQLLRVHPNTLRSRMDKLGIRRRDSETS
ncbi:MAG: sigma 54-interacting transcriptional regulator [Gammaproteobacteria bacterium]